MATAACGDSDDDSGAPKADGSGAAASGRPIEIGYHSLRDLPDINLGFTQGIKYVNEKLGGVDGRPLKLTECIVDGSPEMSIDCANRFVQGNVVAAVQGFDIGADAMLDILKGAELAEIGINALGPQASTAVGHAFFFNSPLESIGLTALLAVQKQGADKVRFFAADDPATRSLRDTVIRPAAAKLKIDGDYIFYTSGSADWTALVTAAKAQGAEAIGLVGGSEPECSAMLTAVTQTRYAGTVLAGACSQFVTDLGAANVKGTLTLSDGYVPRMKGAPEHIAKRLADYEQWMKDAGQAEALKGAYAQYGFALAANVADALGQIEGELTAKSVLAGMRKVKGEKHFGGEYNCDGTEWPGTTACSAEMVVLEVGEDGTQHVVGDGYVDLSAHKPAAK